MGVRRRRGGLLIGAVLFVAACGGGGDDDDGGGGGGGERVDRSERESPLSEFFGSLDEMDDERFGEQERQVEAQVAECMEAQGFEYTPMESSFAAADEGPFDLPDEEFAEKYGFGMFTIDWEEEGLVGEPDDPNQERVEAMSEAERTAYETALWGEFDEETGEQVGSGGCQGEAWAEAGGVESEDEFADLFEEMDAVYTRIEEDSRVKDAARDWSGCMADAGYPDIEGPNTVTELVQQRYDEMAPEEPEVPEEPTVDDPDAVSAEQLPGEDSFGLDPADLEELRAYEIEVAVADYECRAEYDNVFFEVQTEIEQEFIDDNREELERYKESGAF